MIGAPSFSANCSSTGPVPSAPRPARVVTGDREDRLPVQLRVIETVQQVKAAGPGGGQAAAEPAGELRVTASGERRCFFVPHLDEAHPLLALPERLDNAVDAVPREPED